MSPDLLSRLCLAAVATSEESRPRPDCESFRLREQWLHLKRAAYHAQNLRNASSLKRLRVGYRPRRLRSYNKQSRSGFYLAGQRRSVFIRDLKDAGDVGFRFAERLARAHYVGFASYENAPLVAFVSRWGSSADVRVWRP